MAGSPVCDVQSVNNMVDRISQLPNDVLVDILSHLTFCEVGRTSVLARRWRDLWRMTRRLNFATGSIHDILHGSRTPEEVTRRLHAMRSKIRTWVNHVVRWHECPFIEEFSVKADLDTSASEGAAQDIDEWIKFMIRKRVKTVDLDFSGPRVVGVHSMSKECHDYITSVSNLTNLANLKSLRLNYVNVDGELVKYLLSKCPYLEVLSVTYSDTLVYLEVVDPPSLKYLECHSCKIVRKIKIEAPKLEKFVYYGGVVKFYIGSNPRLTELDLGGHLDEDVTYAFVPFGRFLSQLDTLTVRMHLAGMLSDENSPSFGEFSNLRHLILDVQLAVTVVLYYFTDIIAAAPVLAKLTVMFGPMYNPEKRTDLRTWVEPRPHGSLKEVEIFGYSAGRAEFEMAKYVVTNAVNLEKLVIDPKHPQERSMRRLPERLARIEEEEDIEYLKKRLPPSAKLSVNRWT